MNEKMKEILTSMKSFWDRRSRVQKGAIIGSIVAAFAIIITISVFMMSSNMVPLYTNLSLQEAGKIKETLDARAIQSEIRDNGQTILVPEEVADSLKVELAAEGIPDSGNIDYSFFGQNAGFGMTDNEFNMMKLDATQTELANLIKGIDGIQDAKVMINLPQESVFVGEVTKEASASIVLNVQPGYELDQNKVNALYHLVSKSIPNLPTNNIVIMDQNFSYFDLENENSPLNSNVVSQLQLQKEIEQEIRRDVQKLLGTMIGQDKVVVSVTTDIDFTQENREESIVEPVDEDNNEGIAISVERITEAYTGDGANAGGISGTGNTDTVTIQEAGGDGSGEYERIEERVNHEVNRIKKEIVESPYKIRDIGIQVMVEPPKRDDPTSLAQEQVDDIEQILSTIVRTSMYKGTNEEPLTNEQIEDKIVVSVQPFSGKATFEQEAATFAIPIWVYVVLGGAVIVIMLLIFLLVRNRRKQVEFVEGEPLQEEEQVEVRNIFEEREESIDKTTVTRKQIEEMAKEKPDEFAKLLRTWLYED
ncbi:flagellar basal-body MS-ring/collar protein FliF [Bacillus sp. FJAT-47783]|uniref:flagellar basal-body MS-ring/collar protein FliF n=1 Tax=Bacillus sp. FJAT-47783 TaxID=2922712 RepID=UPI001FAB3C27|nr:flagellar basal-body MS-ring/collar protein FliF [Bacillus sp. FJAT-47783]